MNRQTLSILCATVIILVVLRFATSTYQSDALKSPAEDGTSKAIAAVAGAVAMENDYELSAWKVRSSQGAVRLSSELYRAGLTDFLSVFDAPRDLYANEDLLAQSRTAHTVNLIALYKALVAVGNLARFISAPKATSWRKISMKLQSSKKLVVLGATGGSGLEVVRQAIERGHAVTAFVRSPDRLKPFNGRLTVALGDLLNSAELERVLQGHDAVVSAS